MTEKPSPEAKALSLFLMSQKSKSPAFKDQLKRINHQWDLVRQSRITKEEYMEEVETMLNFYGGYDDVVEKTVRHYIETTGEWKLEGDDKYCKDAKLVAKKIQKK